MDSTVMDRRRNKSSTVWSYFDSSDNLSAVCRICNNKLSYNGSSSNLKKHLKRKHPSISLLSDNVSPLVQMFSVVMS